MSPGPAGSRTADAPASATRPRGAHRRAGRKEEEATPASPPTGLPLVDPADTSDPSVASAEHPEAGAAEHEGGPPDLATVALPVVDRPGRKPGALFEKGDPHAGSGPNTAVAVDPSAPAATAAAVVERAGEAPPRREPAHRAGAAPSPWLRRVPVGAAVTFLVVAAAVVAAHVAAAVTSAVRVASAGEVRLAVAALAARGASVVPDPLGLTDRFAALQIAVVELLLPSGDPAAAARWACLGLGAATALMLWPVLRGLRLSVPATAVAVALLGLAQPLLELRAGVTAAAPAALWLTIAGGFAVRQRGWAALACAAVAVATVPMAAVPILGLAGHLVLSRSVRVPAWPLIGALALAAAGTLARLTAGDGPLAGTGGPDVSTPGAVALAIVAVTLLVAAAGVERWARPLITGAMVLVVIGLVPGPSRLTAALLAAPLVTTATAVLVDRIRGRLRWLAPAAVAVLLAAQALVHPGVRPAPPEASLAVWVATQTGAGAVVVADALDRAALLDAGLPAARLRTPEDPPVPGEVRLVSERPGAPAVACPPQLVLATTARGAGGAPGSVCATGGDTDAPAVRARFGTALAGNPMLTLAPAAAAALRAGDVDSRLMLTLAALSGAHRLVVADVPVVALDAPEVPRHQVVLTSFDGAPAGSSDLLVTWLRAQQAPFAPIMVAPDAGGALRLGYPVPAPAGVLPT